VAKTINVPNVKAGSVNVVGRRAGGVSIDIDELDPGDFIDQCSEEEKKLLLDAIGSDLAVEHFGLKLAADE